jgi:hypothetical protein
VPLCDKRAEELILTRLGTFNDVKVQKDFISDLEKATGKANNEILLSDIAKQVGSLDNPWLVFSKYIDAVDQKCVQYMLPDEKMNLEVHES